MPNFLKVAVVRGGRFAFDMATQVLSLDVMNTLRRYNTHGQGVTCLGKVP